MCFLCISIGPVDAGRKKQFRISSNIFPIMVVAERPEDAVSIVRLGEEVVPRVLSILGIEQIPFGTLRIILENEIRDASEWKIIFISDNVKKIFKTSTNQEQNKQKIIKSFIEMVLSSYMKQSDIKHLKAMTVPMWLKEGFMIKLTISKEYYFRFLQDVLADSNAPDFDYLLTDTDEFGLFQAFTAASLMDYILTLPEGNVKICRFLDNVAGSLEQKDAFFKAFQDNFSNVEVLKEKWEDFILSKSIFTSTGLLLSKYEFLKRLESIIELDLSKYGTEKRRNVHLRGDLRDLVFIRDKIVLNKVIAGRIVALQNLAVRVSSQNRLCIKKYIDSLRAARRRKWWLFKKLFFRAEKIRKEIRGRM